MNYVTAFDRRYRYGVVGFGYGACQSFSNRIQQHG
jgi:hypothetical protein